MSDKVKGISRAIEKLELVRNNLILDGENAVLCRQQVDEALAILKGIEKVTGEEVKQAGFSDHIGYNFGRVADEINERIFGG